MAGAGSSESWAGALSNHQRIGDLFLAFVSEGSPELSAKWGLKWCEVPEEHACGKDIFAHLATYLCKTYFITDRAGKPTDQQLSMASVEGIFNGLIQANKKRFLKSTTAATKVRAACPLPRTLTISNTACLAPLLIANQLCPRNGAQDFFNGLLQDKSEEFLWKKGMVAEMNRLTFLRSLHQPKCQDNTEHEIALPHVKLLCASFARAGTKEAAERKLAIKTLWIAAGRAGEPTLMSFEGMRWNAVFETITIESPQSKPAKLKMVLVVAGADRHSDWMLDFGDNLCLDRGSIHFNADKKTWLLPYLMNNNGSASGAATKITSSIKGMQVLSPMISPYPNPLYPYPYP
jgi:hypothetical protein